MDRSLLPKLVATCDTLEDSASPAPPKTGRNGEATRREESRGESQPVSAKEVTEIASAEEDDLLHHQTATAGEAPPAKDLAVGDEPCADASPSEETDWDEIAAFIAEARAAEKAAPAAEPVVKQTGDAGKRNTPVTPSEEDRFLMAVSLGLSLRQAAATVGCDHSTFVKRAKRDRAFAEAIAKARQQARADPLLEVYQASKRSWRAAAWLLNYLDRRDNRGRTKLDAVAIRAQRNG